MPPPSDPSRQIVLSYLDDYLRRGRNVDLGCGTSPCDFRASLDGKISRFLK